MEFDGVGPNRNTFLKIVHLFLRETKKQTQIIRLPKCQNASAILLVLFAKVYVTTKYAKMPRTIKQFTARNILQISSRAKLK